MGAIMRYIHRIWVIIVIGYLFSSVVNLFGGDSAIHEYRKELFLQFPPEIAGCDYKYLDGPQSIGINLDDQLCLFWYDSVYVYDDSGEVERVIPIKPADDFCFDEYGDIYTCTGGSGEVVIRRFAADGKPQGVMTNYRGPNIVAAVFNYYGHRIGYLPRIGLFLYEGWDYLPVSFQPGHFPAMTAAKNTIRTVYAAPVVNINQKRVERNTLELEVYYKTMPKCTVRLVGDDYIKAICLCSRDWDHQYYLIIQKDEDEGNYQYYIQKYDCDDLLFSTDFLPKNQAGILGIGGKKAIVDSRGIIYYYAADYENGVRIFRWILK